MVAGVREARDNQPEPTKKTESWDDQTDAERADAKALFDKVVQEAQEEIKIVLPDISVLLDVLYNAFGWHKRGDSFDDINRVIVYLHNQLEEHGSDLFDNEISGLAAAALLLNLTA